MNKLKKFKKKKVKKKENSLGLRTVSRTALIIALSSSKIRFLFFLFVFFNVFLSLFSSKTLNGRLLELSIEIWAKKGSECRKLLNQQATCR